MQNRAASPLTPDLRERIANRRPLPTRPDGRWFFSGMLCAAALLPLLLAPTGFWRPILVWPLGAQAIPTALYGAAAFLLWFAGLQLVKHPRRGQRMATVALTTTGFLALTMLRASPGTTLFSGASAILFLFTLAQIPREVPDCPHPQALAARARGAATLALAAVGFELLRATELTGTSRIPLLWAAGHALFYGLRWAAAQRASHRVRAGSWLALALLTLVMLALAGRQSLPLLYALTLPALANLWLVPSPSPALRAFWELTVARPERLLVTTFLFLCLLGTGLLSLPQSTADGQALDTLDALFTAVSAVCVTGLIVLDTPHAFSQLGQVLLMLLIQVGGLGIMTFSTATAWILGLRISMRHEQAVASLLNSQREGNLFAVTRRVLLVTFATEAAGALLLLVAFVHRGEALGSAAFRAVFTSISAFCNAGFALQSDSLIPYQQDPFVLYTIAGLIVLGGLSPTVICSLPWFFRRNQPASTIPLQTRLIVAMSALLVVVGFLLYLAIEWNHSLAELSTWDRVHNAFFQAVTFRTAGFNSVDLALMAPATISLSLVLMFVGGSPGGTAGGVKTTTVALLLMTVGQAMNGHTAIQIFGRRISVKSVQGATVVTTVAALVFFLALSSIQLTQNIPTRMAVFEVVSALGTVGLTIGATPMLDEVGKVLIAICMFVGRVGGMALLLLLAQQRTPYTLRRPEEDVDVG